VKNLIFILLGLSICGCSHFMPSGESLEQAPTCKVWKDAALGTKTIANVEGETATFEHSCGITGCSKVFAKYKDSNDIYTSNSGLLTLESKLGAYDGKQFSVDSSIVKVKPFELKDGRATYMSTVMGQTQDVTVHYNPACNQRQAALGVAVIFAR
jgi:hypothetical protein